MVVGRGASDRARAAPAPRNGRGRRRSRRWRVHRALDRACAPGARCLGCRARGGDVRLGRERAQRWLPAWLLVVARSAPRSGRRRRRARDRARGGRRDSGGARSGRGRLAERRRNAVRLGIAGAGRACPAGGRARGGARRSRRSRAGAARAPPPVARLPERSALPRRGDRATGPTRARPVPWSPHLRAQSRRRDRHRTRAHARGRGARSRDRRRDERLGLTLAGRTAARGLPQRDRPYRAGAGSRGADRLAER